MRTDFPLRRGDAITYDVQGERAISFYIVDKENMQRALAGEDFDYEHGQANRRVHEGRFAVPRRDTWSVLVWNESDSDKAVGVVEDLEVE